MNLVLKYSLFITVFFAAIASTFVFTEYANAQANLGSGADQMCIQQCAQKKIEADKAKDPSLNCPMLGKTMIACKATAPGGGTVSGHCIYGVGCKADSASGDKGGNKLDPGLSQLMKGIGDLLKGLGGGGGGGSPPPPPPTPTSGGCTQYYAVSAPSSDPCAYYVPSSGTSSINLGGSTGTDIGSLLSGGTDNSGNDISNLLGGDTSGSNPVSNLLNDVLGGGDTSGASSTVSPGDNQGAVSSSTAQGAAGIGPGGATGDIRVLPNGATIVITNQNTTGNSVTAGFLGTQTSFGNQPDSIVAQWCQTRPWASNFLSYIVPATFFDSLCTLRGFQVGDNPQQGGVAQIGGSSVSIQNPPLSADGNVSGFAPGTVPQSPPISAQIWAVPPKVPLGGRTTIYWTSKNAASCTETSPDGSFSQSTLEGGGATVPLSGATDFTISCLAADGTHTTADVMVNLAL